MFNPFIMQKLSYSYAIVKKWAYSYKWNNMPTTASIL